MVNLNPNELKDGDCESPWIQGWGFRMRVLMGFMMNVDVQVLRGGRVRPVGARAGAAGAHVQCLELCCVRTGCVVRGLQCTARARSSRG